MSRDYVQSRVLEEVIARVAEMLTSISSGVSYETLRRMASDDLQSITKIITPDNELGVAINDIVTRMDPDKDPAAEYPNARDVADIASSLITELVNRTARAIAIPLSVLKDSLIAQVNALSTEISQVIINKTTVETDPSSWKVVVWNPGGACTDNVADSGYTTAAVALCQQKANCLHPGKMIYDYHVGGILDNLRVMPAPDIPEALAPALTDATTNALQSLGGVSDDDIAFCTRLVANSYDVDNLITRAIMVLTGNYTPNAMISLSQDVGRYADIIRRIIDDRANISADLDDVYGERVTYVAEALQMIHGALIALAGSRLQESLIVAVIDRTIYVHPLTYRRWANNGGEDGQIIIAARARTLNGRIVPNVGVSIDSIVRTAEFDTETVADYDAKEQSVSVEKAREIKTAAITQVLTRWYDSAAMLPSGRSETTDLVHRQFMDLAQYQASASDYPIQRFVSDYLVKLFNNPILSTLYRYTRTYIAEQMTKPDVDDSSDAARSLALCHSVMSTLRDFILERFAVAE